MKCEHEVLVFRDPLGDGDFHYIYKCRDCEYIVWVDAPHNNFLSNEYSPR